MTTVATTHGTVRGTADDGLHMFRGIPYAAPPVGARRFRSPQPVEPWTGVREATAYGAAAPQNASALGPMIGFDIGPTAEDCLTLNVWTPGLDDRRRPVLVWIHGGAFIIGAGSQGLYDGAALARRGDVVVVTINYRLGALGFLNLKAVCGEALPASGNEGLLDQVAALRWIRDEISRFGGDPDNVTIFGESAGSISVATLLATPGARGLFRRAILQSGSANFVSSRQGSARVAHAMLDRLGIAPAEAPKLFDVPVTALLEAQQHVFTSLSADFRGLPFAPTVDGDVLPQHPFEAIRQGRAKDVAVVVGSNLDEMKLFGVADPQLRTLDDADLLRRCERIVPGDVQRARQAVDVYRAARTARGASVAANELWFAIDSDRAFRYPATYLAQLQAAHQPDTYCYLWTWPSPAIGGLLGACHALELPFVFGSFSDPMLGAFVGSGPAVEALSSRMQDAWLAFARTGVPAHADLPAWPRYAASTRATMIFDATCRVESAPLEAERAFWEFWDGTH